MVRTRPTLPAGHGELIVHPDYASWPELLADNRAAAASWSFDVGGTDVGGLRALARAEAIDTAVSYSARLGLEVREPGTASGPIVVTGHQPELYHPGIWVKDFLADRFATDNGATALDVVVDTDGFDSVAMTAPCMEPVVRRCQQYLAVGTPSGCYAQAPVPSSDELEKFCQVGSDSLATLPAPSIRRHFLAFCECLRAASGPAQNLADLVTGARRRYEAGVGTGYLEASLVKLAQTESFRRFVAHLALDAEGFRHAYNEELARYRTLTATRSSAQPVPDLRQGAGTELPLWHIGSGGRSAVWAARVGADRVRLHSEAGWELELPADVDGVVEGLVASGALLAPKALALTLFVRLFVADLFIHGVGGGRYDRVTDGIIRRYFGVEPPRFVVASLTMYLPVGAHRVEEEEVAAAKERLHRLVHNPDTLLGEIEFDSASERDHALSLAAEKTELVGQIALPGADRKELGERIRAVNAALGDALAPLRSDFAHHLEQLEGQLKVSDILTDRTYPFCFWDPAEIADKLP